MKPSKNRIDGMYPIAGTPSSRDLNTHSLSLLLAVEREHSPSLGEPQGTPETSFRVIVGRQVLERLDTHVTDCIGSA